MWLTLQVFAIFVFGTISSNGWHYDNDQGKEVCIFNESAPACHFGTFVGVIAFVASIAFLVGEWYERLRYKEDMKMVSSTR